MPEISDTTKAPKAFMSYSWDSEAHRNWVLQLAQRLRKDGVDVELDHWGLQPGDDVQLFIETSIRENRYILIVCTPTYKKKSEARLGGVGYEGTLITAEIYQASGTDVNEKARKRYIPILREGKWQEAAPTWLLSRSYLDLSGEAIDENEYNRLLQTLHGEWPERPPVGSKRPVVRTSAVEAEDITLFDAERKPVAQEEIVGEIRSRGYWRFIFHPLAFLARGIRITDCKSIVLSNSIRLRGWDFPHPPSISENGRMVAGENYYEGCDNWGSMKELWRLYTSGQFLDYRALREDWGKEDHLGDYREIVPMQRLLVTETIFQVTEFLAFTKEVLTNTDVYDEGVFLAITIGNTAGRHLFETDPRRNFGLYDKQTKARDIEVSRLYSKMDILDNAVEIAEQFSLDIFDCFCWDPSTELIKSIQQELLSR